MQCDIDILGDATNLAEIELITATTTLLGKLDFKDFTVRINDRRLLRAMAISCGFADDELDRVFIILDKMDKIGTDGVKEELAAAGFDRDCVDRYIGLFEENTGDRSYLDRLSERLEGFLNEDCTSWLKEIIASVEKVKNADFNVVFDPTLVRGMSYYTGTIFEITMNELGRFTGSKVCACGFSIGFERIITILLDRNFTVPGQQDKYAFLIEKGASADFIADVMNSAMSLRKKGAQVLVAMMNKNKKFQKEQLEKEGFKSDNIKEFYHSEFRT